MKNNNILLIGCGLIAQNMHLPAMLKFFKKRDIAILDKDPKTLKSACKAFDIATSYNDISEVDFNNYSFVVLAVPYQLNYDILNVLLDYKIKILCEKPVVSNYTDYKLLKLKVQNSKAEIFINQTRRFSPLSRDIKKILNGKDDCYKLGNLTSVSYSDGSKFDWDSSSGFYFKNQFGVLLDRGPHAIDLIGWMIDDDLKIVDFFKDSDKLFPESHTHIKLISETRKIPINITLSWKYKLANQVIFNFDHGKILFGVNDLNSYEVIASNKRKTIMAKDSVDNYYDLGKVVFNNFLNFPINSVSFFDVESSIKVISEAYER
ncbi:Gfo/Idh/MocA family oxidoreductase [Candidatus Marinimicrobia bacterium]|nr:Gfo/Idh/MocA family oxidoreductase [Candidatus Neomarinimicrobiota bacterium]